MAITNLRGKIPVYISNTGKEVSKKLAEKLDSVGKLENYGNYSEVKVRNGIASAVEKGTENFGTTTTTHYLKLNAKEELEHISSKSRYHRSPSADDPRQIDALWTANPKTGNATSHSVTSVNGAKTEEKTKKMVNQRSSDMFYDLGGNDYSNVVKDYKNNVYSKTIADPTGKRGVAVEFGTIENADGKEVLKRQIGGMYHPSLGTIGHLNEALKAMQRYPNTIGYQFHNGMTGHQGKILKSINS